MVSSAVIMAPRYLPVGVAVCLPDSAEPPVRSHPPPPTSIPLCRPNENRSARLER